jgi:hypothetical protein
VGDKFKDILDAETLTSLMMTGKDFGKESKEKKSGEHVTIAIGDKEVDYKKALGMHICFIHITVHTLCHGLLLILSFTYSLTIRKIFILKLEFGIVNLPLLFRNSYAPFPSFKIEVKYTNVIF